MVGLRDKRERPGYLVDGRNLGLPGNPRWGGSVGRLVDLGFSDGSDTLGFCGELPR
jgi:hypothetical protein